MGDLTGSTICGDSSQICALFPFVSLASSRNRNEQESNLNNRYQLISRDSGNVEVQFRTF